MAHGILELDHDDAELERNKKYGTLCFAQKICRRYYMDMRPKTKASRLVLFARQVGFRHTYCKFLLAALPSSRMLTLLQVPDLPPTLRSCGALTKMMMQCSWSAREPGYIACMSVQGACCQADKTHGVKERRGRYMHDYDMTTCES